MKGILPMGMAKKLTVPILLLLRLQMQALILYMRMSIQVHPSGLI